MDANLINAFHKATIHVLETMAQTKIVSGKPHVKEGAERYGAITGVIGMVGDRISGNMAISFDRAAVLEIVSNMLFEKYEEISPDVVDAVGELTNIICGNAKTHLFEAGFKFEMATPSIITGENISISQMRSAPIIVIPFTTPSGTIIIEASFKEIKPISKSM